MRYYTKQDSTGWNVHDSQDKRRKVASFGHHPLSHAFAEEHAWRLDAEHNRASETAQWQKDVRDELGDEA